MACSGAGIDLEEVVGADMPAEQPAIAAAGTFASAEVLLIEGRSQNDGALLVREFGPSLDEARRNVKRRLVLSQGTMHNNDDASKSAARNVLVVDAMRRTPTGSGGPFRKDVPRTAIVIQSASLEGAATAPDAMTATPSSPTASPAAVTQ